ncbi:NACHT domain-containing protein [Clavibacter michiganensis]|uniref:NACHT domain-containing protein n=1 Tax=Clavibacter michiganensis TaxID=28447 RepID=UPI003DA13DCB
MPDSDTLDINAIIAGAIANLVSDAVQFVARRVVLRGPSAGGAGRRSLLGRELEASDESSTLGTISRIALLNIADDKLSAEQLGTAIQSRAVQSATRSLLAAHLIPGNYSYIAAAQRQFESELARILLDLPGMSDASQEALNGLVGEVTRLVTAACEARAQAVTSTADKDGATRVSPYVEVALAVAHRIEEALSVLSHAPSPKEVADWQKSLRRQAQLLHGRILIPDFRDRRYVPLQDLYIPGRLTPHRRRESQAHNPVSYSVFDLYEHIDRDVILGDPGGGKTTATNAIALQYASDHTAPAPIVIELREFAKVIDEYSLAEYIDVAVRNRYQIPAIPGVLSYLLTTGGVMVIFDGLDELLDAHKRAVVAERIELFANNYSNVKILVTSRRVGYAEARLDPTLFAAHELSSYRLEDVEEYVEKWFAVQADVPLGQKQGLIDAFLAESAAIDDLRTNPLLLALLCIIYRGQSYLPSSLLDIYEQCSKLLFQTWDRSRGIRFNFTFEPFIDDALKHLAYSMFTSEGTADGVPEHQLKSDILDYFAAEAFADKAGAMRASEEFVDFCKGRAWVLTEVGLSAENHALFKFTHRTFMEYFAAMQLSRLYSDPAVLGRSLLPFVSKNEWDVVGRLAIHITNRSSARGAEIAIMAMLASISRRSWGYKENVLDFLARTLDYLPTSPRVAEAVARACLESVVTGIAQGKAAASLALFRLIDVHERFDGVIDDVVIDTVRTWSADPGLVTQEAASFFVSNFGVSVDAPAVAERYSKLDHEISEELFEKGVLPGSSKWMLIYRMWAIRGVNAEMTATRLAALDAGRLDWMLLDFPIPFRTFRSGQPVSFFFEQAVLEVSRVGEEGYEAEAEAEAEAEGLNFASLFDALSDAIDPAHPALTKALVGNVSDRLGYFLRGQTDGSEILSIRDESRGALGVLLILSHYVSSAHDPVSLSQKEVGLGLRLIAMWQERGRGASVPQLDALISEAKDNIQKYLEVHAGG